MHNEGRASKACSGYGLVRLDSKTGGCECGMRADGLELTMKTTPHKGVDRDYIWLRGCQNPGLDLGFPEKYCAKRRSLPIGLPSLYHP